MSDGLHNVSGADGTIELSGKVYRASKVTLRMYGEVEAHIVAQRPDLLERIGKSLEKVPQKYHEKIIKAAVDKAEATQRATPAEVDRFMNSYEGACFLFWMMVRGHHPELASPEAAKAILESVPLKELQAKLDTAGGMNPVKNSAGREPMATPAQTNGHPAASPGPSSIERLAEITAGPHTSSAI